MTVRNRLILTVALSLLGAIGLLIATVTAPMQRTFTDLDHRDGEQQLQRIGEAFRLVNKTQYDRAIDWAQWDDAYRFLIDKSPEFVTVNMTPQTVSEMKLDALAFFRPDGSLFEGSFPRRITDLAPLDLNMVQESLRWPQLLAEPGFKKEGVHGYVLVGRELVSVIVRPVLRSDQTGPSNGYLLFARRYGHDFQAIVRDVTQIDASVRDLDDAEVTGSMRATIAGTGMFAPRLDDVQRHGYLQLKSIFGEPIALVRAPLKHSIAEAGMKSVSRLSWSIFGVGLLACVLITVLVDRFVLRRLFSLRAQMQAIRSSEGARVAMSGTDEFADLAGTVNDMLATLDQESLKLRQSQDELRSQNTSLNSAIETVEYQANHDALTGLANRALFNRCLLASLERGRAEGHAVAVAYLDLDSFKMVNDSLGHMAGDELLVMVGRRLQQCVRSEDVIARLGGDEFVVLVRDLVSKDDAASIIARIMEDLSFPYVLAGQELFAMASIGVAYAPRCRDSAEEMMKKADTALYAAKARGKGCFEFFSDDMDHASTERLELSNMLRKAVVNHEIDVHFQPIVDLQTGLVHGAEALARWTHARRGPISPAEFIPIAEQCGLIGELGYRVMEKACEAAFAWTQLPGYEGFRMSVNLSGRQLAQSDVVSKVRAILERTGLPAPNLQIELTESVLIDEDSAKSKISALRELGVAFALDDFGTGYSSLSTLHQHPIDCLKIDRSFVMTIDEDEHARAVVEAILSMTKVMRIDVVAEGIETVTQGEFLRGQQCQFGQGYFYSRPIPGAEFERLLAGWSSAEAA
ncbi:MAG: EAL domain-containing protein [Chthonomonas sp.]|nr:EAL domain-containing protein [Chthonomonas sp.]